MHQKGKLVEKAGETGNTDEEISGFASLKEKVCALVSTRKQRELN